MDNHWNEKGHEVAADEVLARLIDWKPISEARSR
jgi:hypothetical protein